MTSIPTLPDAVVPSRQPLALPPAWWRRGLQVLAWGLVAAWSLLLIAWLTLHWGILNHIEQWRPQIEARAGEAIGAKVQIGNISVRSGSWVPALELRDVVVFDAQQREAIRLPHVFAAVSPRSLLALAPRLSQLLIEGAELDVRRDAAGQFFVGGLPVREAGVPGDGGELADWFFKQYEFVVRGGTLRWTDERRSAPALVLSDLSFVVRNGLRRHDLRLDATPPAAWGSRFTVQGRFTQPLLARAGDWRLWSGPLQLDLPQADVSELRRYVELPFDLSEGAGALRGWLELRTGEPRELTLDLALRSVALRLAADVEPMVFAQVEGRLQGTRSADGISLRAERFGFLTGDGLQWPRGDAQLSWRQRQDAVGAPTVAAPVTGGTFTAQRLDLGVMAAIASRVPMGASLHALLGQSAPKGIVSDLVANWDGPLDAPDRYSVKSRFSGLSLAAGPLNGPHGVGRPGLRQADIELDANERGGSAALAMHNGAIELPGVFEQPLIPLDRLSADLAWSITPAQTPGAPAQIEVQVKNASFANSDAHSELQASWRTGPGTAAGKGGRYPGQLALDGTLGNGVAARTARYLPLGLPRHVRDWVAHAITSGTLSNAAYHVKGDLAEFPYAEPAKKGEAAGEFRITGHVDEVDLAYVPSMPTSSAGGVVTPAFTSPWPPFNRVSADLIFDRASMEIRNGSGQVRGVNLSGVQGGIRNLEQASLQIDGTAQGALNDLLHYATSSPVDALTGGALAPIGASGPAELKLSLAIPLDDTDKTTVKGSVSLAGNDLRLRPGVPVLAAARGRVDFTQHGFAVVGASARLLGGEASFEGGSQPDGSLRFNGQGVVSADGLRSAGELGALTRVAGSLSGQAPYQLALRFVHGLPEFNLSSNLVGMALDLPAPLGKSAEAALPMRVQNQLLPESLAPGQSPRDSLRADLGNLLRLQYERDLAHGEPQVLRGGIGVGEPAPQPSRGVQASLTLAQLDADAWQALSDRWSGTSATAESGLGGGYLPTTIGLHVGNLTIASRRLSAVVAGISQADGIWRANVDADQLNGYLEYRVPRRNSGDGLVYARLKRLVLPKTEADSMESLLDKQPASVPALDIVVDEFELRGLRLGRLEVEALNLGEGAESTRSWQLKRFSLAMPEARLDGSGDWAMPTARSGGRRRAGIDFTLDMSDSGALLERLGLGKTLKGGKGQIAGRVDWLGSPLSPDFASMSGQFKLGVQSGQFLKVDAGPAKLLGVLSLQNLPRLLQLDFRDVFQSGFPFDSVDGDVKIVQGVASTNNFHMRGAQAAVFMEGRADLVHENEDLRVVVVPEINAGTASLAYAVVNPAIGLGTFLAQLFLRKPMMQAATREFHISGTWADPKVEPIQRKLGDPIPEFEPAAAASAPR